MIMMESASNRSSASYCILPARRDQRGGDGKDERVIEALDVSCKLRMDESSVVRGGESSMYVSRFTLVDACWHSKLTSALSRIFCGG